MKASTPRADVEPRAQMLTTATPRPRRRARRVVFGASRLEAA